MICYQFRAAHSDARHGLVQAEIEVEAETEVEVVDVVVDVVVVVVELFQGRR